MDLPPLDELYFPWLYKLVGDSEEPNRHLTYWGMLKQLYTKEFVWVVPNDDNRIEDGRDLRTEFVEQTGLARVERDWMQLPCSMLELLIGLSRRLSFEAEGEPREWFWELLRNLDLHIYNDACQPLPGDLIDSILERVIWRTYEPSGRGGIFPLATAREDQRQVELWYQLCAYVLELNLV